MNDKNGYLKQRQTIQRDALLHSIYATGYKAGVMGMLDRVIHIIDHYDVFDPNKVRRMFHIASGDLKAAMNELDERYANFESSLDDKNKADVRRRKNERAKKKS